MNIINNFWIKNFMIPFLLILPILWFVFPAITLGTDNLRMMAHFDNDEAILVSFAGKTYLKGLIPLETGAAYPQLFYYLAGIILFPLTWLRGINYQIIVVGLRGFNLLVALTTVCFLYFFSLKYLKITWAAVLCCLLLITTPYYLPWIINSRPHLLAVLFALAGLYFCLKLIEIDKPQYFLSAILFSAFAAATNLLFGFVMIPAIWMASVYNLSRLPPTQLIEHLKVKYRIINLIASSVVVFTVSFFALGAFLLVKHQSFFYRSKIRGVHDFLQIRNVRMLIFLVGLLLLAGIVWIIINNYLRKIASNDQLGRYSRRLFIANNSFLTLFYIIGVLGILFLALTPTYWLFPLVTGKVLMGQFIATTMSTSVDLSINKSFVDFNRLVWIKMLFDQKLLGMWFGLLFLFYLIFEVVFFKKNWSQNRIYLIQRGILWVYMATLMIVLVLFVSHRTGHYLFSILPLAGLLISFGVTQSIKESKTRILSLLLLFIFSAFFGLGLYARWGEICKARDIKLSKINDTGISVGNWLTERFPSDTKIWRECDAFYIPPKFEQLYFPLKPEIVDPSEINRIKPDIFVLLSSPVEKQIINLSLAGKIPFYERIKHLNYSNKLHEFKEVFVLQKRR